MKKIQITIFVAMFILLSGCSSSATNNQQDVDKTQTPKNSQITALQSDIDKLQQEVETLKGIIEAAPYLPQIPKQEFPKGTIEEYQLSITHFGGAGSKIYQLAAGYPSPATGGEMEWYGMQYGVQNFANVTFNSAYNVLYLMCREGYEATSAESWTDNEPIEVDGYYGLILDENPVVNSVSMLCKKVSNTETTSGSSSDEATSDSSTEREAMTKAIELVGQQYPEFKDFPGNRFGGGSIEAQQSGDSWIVALITHGSGVPVIAGDCFMVEGDKVEKLDDNENMNSMMQIAFEECQNMLKAAGKIPL